MTKAEATRQVQAFFKAHDVSSPGLNEKGVGGAALEAGEVYFQYLPEPGALKCSALIYRFRGVPNPKVISAFQEEEKTTDTGGGRFEFDPTNRCAFLSRVYDAPVEPKAFQEQLMKLLGACQTWKGEVVVRVSDKAYGRAP